MKKFITSTLLVLGLFAGLASRSFADDLEKFAGKWSLSATNNGQIYTQSLEITKNKFVFRIADPDKKTVLYAKGEVKMDKCGDLKTVTFFKIEGSQTEEDLQPVEDDRHMVYVLDGDSLTLATNFDHFREKGPRIDVYTRVQK